MLKKQIFTKMPSVPNGLKKNVVSFKHNLRDRSIDTKMYMK